MFNFHDCCFLRTTFNVDEIEYADSTKSNFRYIEFYRINFTDVNFCDIKFTQIHFIKVDFKHTFLVDVIFRDINFNLCYFVDVDITDVGFNSVYFIGGNFQVRNPVEITSPSHLPRFIGTKIDTENFNFKGKIVPDEFFELCC